MFEELSDIFSDHDNYLTSRELLMKVRIHLSCKACDPIKAEISPFSNQLPKLISPWTTVRGGFIAPQRTYTSIYSHILALWIYILLCIERWTASWGTLWADLERLRFAPMSAEHLQTRFSTGLHHCSAFDFTGTMPLRFSWGIKPRCLSNYLVPFLELENRAGNFKGTGFLLCVWSDGQQSRLCLKQFDLCALLSEPQQAPELERSEEE